MPLYESVFIARQDLSPAQVETLTSDVTNIITKEGGKVTKTEQWGLKTLAYRIRKNKKGHYVLINIDAPSAAIMEMERNMRINEDVLRYLSIRVDELEEGPSIMLRKNADDMEGASSPRPYGNRDGASRGGNSYGDSGRAMRPRRNATEGEGVEE